MPGTGSGGARAAGKQGEGEPVTLCLLCPGQGGQSAGMLGRLRTDPLLTRHLRRLLCHLPGDVLALAADPSRCFLNRHAQPLIVLYGLVVAAALHDDGVDPGIVAGYSVGELTAHGVAGALAEEDVLALAGRRAACMDAAAPGGCGMLAVRGVSLDRLLSLAREAGVAQAIRNGADHAVLAGPQPALEELAATLTTTGAHLVSLPISVPAHTPWLAHAVAPFQAALTAVPWHAHAAFVPAGIDGRAVASAGEAVPALARQIAAPIDWERVMDVTKEMGATVYFELGPGTALTRMMRERHPGIPARALEEFASVQGALAWLRRHGAGR